MKTIFRRLLRFKDPNGHVYFGEVPQGVIQSQIIGSRVSIYAGEQPEYLKRTDECREVAEILCPVPSVPIVYGIGYNYATHIDETKHESESLYPTIFTKPPGAVAGPYDEIPIEPSCTEELDYEGELVFVIGKACKNFHSSEDITPYILGYTVGNDVSSRYWQFARSNGQHSYPKSFDKFAPVGPLLISTSVVQDPTVLTIETRVNGEVRQADTTKNMIFNIGMILEYISRATTLIPGTLVFTGTPAGVALGMSDPKWLKDGDEVEVEISEIGLIKNRFKHYK